MTEAELQAKMNEAAAEFDRGSAWGLPDRFDAQVAAAHTAAIADIDAERERSKARREAVNDTEKGA